MLDDQILHCLTDLQDECSKPSRCLTNTAEETVTIQITSEVHYLVCLILGVMVAHEQLALCLWQNNRLKALVRNEGIHTFKMPRLIYKANLNVSSLQNVSHCDNTVKQKQAFGGQKFESIKFW